MPESICENYPSINLTIECFKKAIITALSGKLPSGLTQEELCYFCLGVITEEDLTMDKQWIPIDGRSALIITKMHLTEEGRQKIEAAKAVLGEWPDLDDEGK